MPKKSKPFINKKECLSFSVVRRSQRDTLLDDVAGEDDDDAYGGGYGGGSAAADLVKSLTSHSGTLELSRATDEAALRAARLARLASQGKSPFVLVPTSSQNSKQRKQMASLFGEDGTFVATGGPDQRPPPPPPPPRSSGGAKKASLSSNPLDHINEMGLPNDGYDYKQHLRTFNSDLEGTSSHIMSPSGRFIPRSEDPLSRPVGTGARLGLEALAASLPREAFAGAVETERRLEAISIDPALMDRDIYEALFGEGGGEDGEMFGDDGAFEELADDFVIEADKEAAPTTEGQEGEEGAAKAFDYDEHVRDLIRKSELKNFGGSKEQRSVDIDKDFVGVKFSRGKKHDDEDEDEDDEDDDDDDEEDDYLDEDGEEFDTDDDGSLRDDDDD